MAHFFPFTEAWKPTFSSQEAAITTLLSRHNVGCEHAFRALSTPPTSSTGGHQTCSPPLRSHTRHKLLCHLIICICLYIHTFVTSRHEKKPHENRTSKKSFMVTNYSSKEHLAGQCHISGQHNKPICPDSPSEICPHLGTSRGSPQPKSRPGARRDHSNTQACAQTLFSLFI